MPNVAVLVAELPDLVPSKQAAKLIGRRHEWLCRLRKQPGGGPIPWYLIEGRIYYATEDIRTWVASCRRGGAIAEGATA